MAPEDRVKQYVALWLQLGKQVVCDRNNSLSGTQRVIEGERYSSEFEQFWQQITQQPQYYHLAGTDCSLADLLDGHWELLPCARCTLLYPVNEERLEAGPCPCQDLALWPDELPPPRGPISGHSYLEQIRLRLSRSDYVDPSPVQ